MGLRMKIHSLLLREECAPGTLACNKWIDSPGHGPERRIGQKAEAAVGYTMQCNSLPQSRIT